MGLILAIDTAASLCAACLFDPAADQFVGHGSRDIGKGHAEQLMDVIAVAMAGRPYADLTRIAVSVGPGSFTGIRVGVSAARGFALALKVPAVGVTTLEAIATEGRERFGSRPVFAVLDGGRGAVHAALYDGAGAIVAAPRAISLEEAALLARQTAPVLTGSAALAVAEAAGIELPVASTAPTADIATYARIGAALPLGDKPKPLYLRGADARPQAGFTVARQGA